MIDECSIGSVWTGLVGVKHFKSSLNVAQLFVNTTEKVAVVPEIAPVCF